jgi:hypothetical protein
MVVPSVIRDITERRESEELARQNADMKIAVAVKTAELASVKKELALVAKRERIAQAPRRSEARLGMITENAGITGEMLARMALDSTRPILPQPTDRTSPP